MAIKKGKNRVYCRNKIPMFFGVGLIAVVLFVGIGVASATDYYVSLSGENSNDGATLDTAWRTIAYAGAKAQAGDTVHIKGGNYGHEHMVIKNSGTATNPIVFEGFDGTPVIDGQDNTGTGIYVKYKDYITLRNINVTKYKYGALVEDANYITMDNINVNFIGHTGIFIKLAEHCTLQNSEVKDADQHNIWLEKAHYNLIENCVSLGERTDMGQGDGGTDYYIALSYGHDNIIRDCLSYNMHPGHGHRGHGIGIKDNWVDGIGYYAPHSYNNTIANCTCYQHQENLYVRHFAYNNTIIDSTAYRGDLPPDYHCLGLNAGCDGAHNNTFKNITVHNFKFQFNFVQSGENPGWCPSENNTLIGCIAIGGNNALRFEYANNIQIDNCIFNGSERLFYLRDSQTEISLKNCIVTNVPTWSSGSGSPTITYSDFWNNDFSMPSGAGNINANPLFVDPAKGDYHLQLDSPCCGAGEGGKDMGAYPEGESRDVGTITGTVTDGINPIQGATVTADGYSDPDGTDSNGYYEISNVPVGLYTVTASATGYHPESQEDVQVSKDQTTTVDFLLTEAPDLAGNWQFEEGERTTAYDSSDYGNDGTITGAEYTTSSKIGDYALQFDGLDDYVEVQDSASLDITDAVTVLAWIKPDTVDGRHSVLGKRDAYTFKTLGSEISFTTPGIKGHTSTGAGLVTGSWQHVAVAFVADDMARFYKDGAFISSYSASTMSSSTYPLLIGNNQWNQRFRGIIDEVKIYNRALSAEEIKADYENGTANHPPTAFVDSITPDPSEQGKDTVSFTGHGTDQDGSVVAYNWSSSIDGLLSTESSFSKPASELSEGTHTIYFKVQDDRGVWSAGVTADLMIHQAPENQPPVAEWQFDEGSGQVVYDTSVNGNDGTIHGTRWTTGKLGSALDFDGLDDYVEVQDSASLDITDAVTILAWIKPDTVDDRHSVLGKRDAYTFKTLGSEISFTTPGIKGHTSNGADLVAGSWQHVAVVFVADDMVRFYKDGVFISSDSASTMSSSTYPLLVGNNQWSERFSGIIDGVKIYNRALSAEEIRRDYEAGFKIPNYDVNEDGFVDISDTTIVGQHLDETTNPPYPRYDVNEDGFVDDLDISIVDQHFGEITS